MQSLGKITKGKGEAQQHQDQNVFHGQTSIPKGQAKSILLASELSALSFVLGILYLHLTKHQAQSTKNKILSEKLGLGRRHVILSPFPPKHPLTSNARKR